MQQTGSLAWPAEPWPRPWLCCPAPRDWAQRSAVQRGRGRPRSLLCSSLTFWEGGRRSFLIGWAGLSASCSRGGQPSASTGAGGQPARAARPGSPSQPCAWSSWAYAAARRHPGSAQHPVQRLRLSASAGCLDGSLLTSDRTPGRSTGSSWRAQQVQHRDEEFCTLFLACAPRTMACTCAAPSLASRPALRHQQPRHATAGAVARNHGCALGTNGSSSCQTWGSTRRTGKRLVSEPQAVCRLRQSRCLRLRAEPGRSFNEKTGEVRRAAVRALAALHA